MLFLITFQHESHTSVILKYLQVLQKAICFGTQLALSKKPFHLFLSNHFLLTLQDSG